MREAEKDDEFIALVMFVWLVQLSAVNGTSMISKHTDASLAEQPTRPRIDAVLRGINLHWDENIRSTQSSGLSWFDICCGK